MSVEAALLSPFEEINPELPAGTLIASCEVMALQDSANPPQNPPQLPFFTSRPVTRLMFQQAPKNEKRNVTHEGMHYSPKEIHKGRKVKLDQAKY